VLGIIMGTNTKEYMVQYYQKNKEKIKKRAKTYYNDNERAYKKIIALQFYSDGYMTCELCGEGNIDVLTIDHMHGGGTKHRKTFDRGGAIYKWLYDNEFPDGFRILCRNCNWKERLKNIK